jgi:hypothetical protein
VKAARRDATAAPFDSGIRVAANMVEVHVADNEDDNMIVVPIPGEDNEAERQRIRKSNDRDQDMERHGRQSPHNVGYDEAADGIPTPEIERAVDK